MGPSLEGLGVSEVAWNDFKADAETAMNWIPWFVKSLVFVVFVMCILFFICPPVALCGLLCCALIGFFGMCCLKLRMHLGVGYAAKVHLAKFGIAAEYKR